MKDLRSTPLRPARTYDGPGVAFELTAVRVVETNRPCVVNNVVGWATKIGTLGRYVDPASAAATEIAVGEEFTMKVGGVHELPLEGAYAAAAVGAMLWINPADDAVDDVSAIGWLPLGVIIAIDAARTPDVARVNTNCWQAFGAA